MDIGFIILGVLLTFGTLLFLFNIKRILVRCIIASANHILCIPLLVKSIKYNLPYGIVIAFLYIWFALVVICISLFLLDDLSNNNMEEEEDTTDIANEEFDTFF